MLALRKKRLAETHPFLRGGFRPFFFGAASWAVIALALWLGLLVGLLELPIRFSPTQWHRHEMIFGFVGAAISGFLLTAIPNWTGRLPIAGKPLLTLFSLWIAARVGVSFSQFVGWWPAAALDVGLYAVLAILAAREVIASKNRNLPVVGLVLLFGLADALDYAGAAGFVSADFGWRLAIALVVIMISMIGGRIIPSFTRNWMVKNGARGTLPSQPQQLDLVVLASTVIALVFWLAHPMQRLSGWMLILAALAQALRLSRWGGLRSTRDPLVWILHVGYAWIPVGLGLLGLAGAGAPIVRSAGIHALTAGAMTTMILAVMSRASLGHTGRELRAAPLTVTAYICVTAGGLWRVGAALSPGRYYQLMLLAAGTLWAAALLLFLIAYSPVLWTARVGDRAASR